MRFQISFLVYGAAAIRSSCFLMKMSLENFFPFGWLLTRTLAKMLVAILLDDQLCKIAKKKNVFSNS